MLIFSMYNSQFLFYDALIFLILGIPFLPLTSDKDYWCILIVFIFDIIEYISYGNFFWSELGWLNSNWDYKSFVNCLNFVKTLKLRENLERKYLNFEVIPFLIKLYHLIIDTFNGGRSLGNENTKYTSFRPLKITNASK